MLTAQPVGSPTTYEGAKSTSSSAGPQAPGDEVDVGSEVGVNGEVCAGAEGSGSEPS